MTALTTPPESRLAPPPTAGSFPPRKSLPKDANLCDYCTAKCCKYFALPIEKPETREDYDNLRWYMYHGPVQLFVDDDTWFLMVLQQCQHLQADHRCGVYEIRPQICRDYSTKNCEYDNEGVYDMYFETPEQLHEYAVAVLPPEPRKPVMESELPILLAE